MTVPKLVIQLVVVSLGSKPFITAAAVAFIALLDQQSFL